MQLPDNIIALLKKEGKTQIEYKKLESFLLSAYETLSAKDIKELILDISGQIKSNIGAEEAYRFFGKQYATFEKEHTRRFSQKLELLYHLAALSAECEDYKTSQKHAFDYLLNAVAKVSVNKANTQMGYYSFRGFSDYSLQDISKETISLAHPRMFNDPLDTLLDWWISCNIQVDSKDFNKEFSIFLKKASEHLKLRCLIGDLKDGVPMEVEQLPVLMWSHYAESHSGFCVKYKFDNDVYKEFAPGEKKLTFIHPVSYNLDTISLDSVPSMDVGLLTKSKEWEYENEMRLVYLNLTDDSDFPVISCKGCIKDIYLGVKCSDANQRRMEKAIGDKDVKLYKMQIDKDNPTKLIKNRIG